MGCGRTINVEVAEHRLLHALYEAVFFYNRNPNAGSHAAVISALGEANRFFNGADMRNYSNSPRVESGKKKNRTNLQDRETMSQTAKGGKRG